MINPKVQDALNNQIQKEFYASYLYLSMAGYFEQANLPGFAQWFRLQSQEEHMHAMRLFDHVHDRGGRVILQALDAPTADFDSPLDVMKLALHHEQKVTASIGALYNLAVEENDYPAQVELQWFITEQVEEEKVVGEIVDQLALVDGNPLALFMIDRELGGRQPEEGA